MRTFTFYCVILIAMLTTAGVTSFAQYRANFPNELHGFKFYRDGRLADIKLTISTTADVAKILGEECLKTCDLDENWQVNIFRALKGGRACTGIECKTKLTILPEYVGKVWSITITPKTRVSFADITFSEKFQHGISGPLEWDKNTYNVYWDEDDLSYKLFAEDSADGKHRKGDLKEIQYRTPWNVDLPFYSVSQCPSRCF